MGDEQQEFAYRSQLIVTNRGCNFLPAKPIANSVISNKDPFALSSIRVVLCAFLLSSLLSYKREISCSSPVY